MNKVFLTGRIGKDPELFTFDNGDKKTSFTLATTEKWMKDKEWKESTEWHNIVVNRETKLQKGDLIAVEGRIKSRKYTAKDGTEKYMTEILAQKTEFLHRKDDGTKQSSGEYNEPPF